ncbi:MAG: [LysW]-lysine hydrolase [Anaerolineae bacterium]|nr:[LysW]-lysine hydrolase [Anaerolineae bacterium]
MSKINTPAFTTNIEAENLLQDLVSTPSLSHHEQDAVHLLVDWMQNKGYSEAYVDEAGNAVGIIGSGSNDIVLLGHIDTFPGVVPVRRKGRLLYGRGTVDAKGPLCTFAAAATRVELPTDTRLIVIGAVEEEAATSKGARHVTSCFSPRCCIIGEPSQWDRITLGYKGRLLLDWQWSGPLAHSAGLTLSPAEQALAYWDEVRAYTEHYNSDKEKIFDQLDVSLRDINTGQDGAFGHARMTIGFRLPPRLSPASIVNGLKPESSATVKPYGAEQAFVADRDTVLSRAFRGAIRSEGGQPRFVYKTGTADMNVVGPVWNCPIVAYGPGDSALDHTPEEHIHLDEYLRAVNVLAACLQRVASDIGVKASSTVE